MKAETKTEFKYFTNPLDYVMTALSIVSCFVGAASVVSLWNYRTTQLEVYKQEFKAAYARDPNYWYPRPTDLWMSVLFGVVLDNVELPIKKLVWRYFYENQKPTNQELQRIFKAEKAAGYIFKFVYANFIVAVGYKVLLKTDFLPPEMGGAETNHLRYLWSNFPVVDEPYGNELRYYYIMSFGYHLWSTVKMLYTHFFLQPRADIQEMTLHHICTLLLVFISYLIGYFKFGSVVMLLHDATDIVISVFRAFSETKYLWLKWTFGVVIIFIWPYLRLYVFYDVIFNGLYKYPQEVVYPNRHIEGHVDQAKAHFTICQYPIITFLCFLYLLHIYWYLLIIRLAFVNLGGEKEDKNVRVTSGNLQVRDSAYLQGIKQAMLGERNKDD